MIDYGNFRKALKNLEVQYENRKNLDDDTPPATQEAYAESVVQRFEVCYEVSWKTLMRYIKEDLGLSDVEEHAKAVYRSAAKNNLFSTPVEQWYKYFDARNKTSHEYGGEVIINVLDIVEDFIDDAIGLYQTMSGETWE